MLTEEKILLNNIRDFRKTTLNEAAGENAIRDAIEKHKFLYVYYNGDDATQKGYRTILPFVLGSHKESGDRVVRAWQQAGSSLSYRNKPTSSRYGHRFEKGHEYFNNPKGGGTNPGWRLFRIDKIGSIMPTGERFNPNDYFSVDGINYRPDDAAINVDVAIQKYTGAPYRASGGDSADEPDVTATKVPPSTFDTQYSKFKQFFKPAQLRTRQVTKDEVQDLWDMVQKYRKKSPGDYFVIQNEMGDMVLKTPRGIEIDNIPDQAVVGNLKDLYNKLIVPYKPKQDALYKQATDQLEKEVGQ
jgi:hypothetical protein